MQVDTLNESSNSQLNLQSFSLLKGNEIQQIDDVKNFISTYKQNSLEKIKKDDQKNYQQLRMQLILQKNNQKEEQRKFLKKHRNMSQLVTLRKKQEFDSKESLFQNNLQLPEIVSKKVGDFKQRIQPDIRQLKQSYQEMKNNIKADQFESENTLKKKKGVIQEQSQPKQNSDQKSSSIIKKQDNFHHRMQPFSKTKINSSKIIQIPQVLQENNSQSFIIDQHDQILRKIDSDNYSIDSPQNDYENYFSQSDKINQNMQIQGDIFINDFLKKQIQKQKIERKSSAILNSGENSFQPHLKNYESLTLLNNGSSKLIIPTTKNEPSIENLIESPTYQQSQRIQSLSDYEQSLISQNQNPDILQMYSKFNDFESLQMNLINLRTLVPKKKDYSFSLEQQNEEKQNKIYMNDYGLINQNIQNKKYLKVNFSNKKPTNWQKQIQGKNLMININFRQSSFIEKDNKQLDLSLQKNAKKLNKNGSFFTSSRNSIEIEKKEDSINDQSFLKVTPLCASGKISGNQSKVLLSEQDFYKNSNSKKNSKIISVESSIKNMKKYLKQINNLRPLKSQIHNDNEELMKIVKVKNLEEILNEQKEQKIKNEIITDLKNYKYLKNSNILEMLQQKNKNYQHFIIKLEKTERQIMDNSVSCQVSQQIANEAENLQQINMESSLQYLSLEITKYIINNSIQAQNNLQIVQQLFTEENQQKSSSDNQQIQTNEQNYERLETPEAVMQNEIFLFQNKQSLLKKIEEMKANDKTINLEKEIQNSILNKSDESQLQSINQSDQFIISGQDLTIDNNNFINLPSLDDNLLMVFSNILSPMQKIKLLKDRVNKEIQHNSQILQELQFKLDSNLDKNFNQRQQQSQDTKMLKLQKVKLLDMEPNINQKVICKENSIEKKKKNALKLNQDLKDVGVKTQLQDTQNNDNIPFINISDINNQIFPNND